MPAPLWFLCYFATYLATAERADDVSWYSRELSGLTRYYFGWFGGVQASEKGLCLVGGDFSLQVLGMHDPRKPKTEFSPLDWILEAGTEVTVPLGAAVSFLHGEVARFALSPLPEELAAWGFSAMFRMRVRLHGAPVVDTALILLLRERDSGGDSGRRICLMPDDIAAAKRIIAAGGFLPDGHARKAMGMIVVDGKKQTEPVK